jgi:hypothetical protein
MTLTPRDGDVVKDYINAFYALLLLPYDKYRRKC